MQARTSARPFITMLPDGRPVDAIEPHEAVAMYPELNAVDVPFLNDDAFNAVRHLTKPGFEMSRVEHADGSRSLVWTALPRNDSTQNVA